MIKIPKFINYNVGDGTYCVGCKNKAKIRKSWCRLKHVIIGLDGGCDECATIFKSLEVFFKKIDKCPDYVPDPDYWQKDEYG